MAADPKSLRRKIHLDLGDLTDARVDAIVNAANNDLMLGGGVAGAIRRKGGPTIQEECDRHGPIAVGEAAITNAGRLPARHVIHAASMSLGGRATEPALRSSVRRSFEIAAEHKLRSIALPAVGAGIAGFPLDACARIMIGEAVRALEGGTSIEEIRFVLYDQQAYDAFLQALETD